MTRDEVLSAIRAHEADLRQAGVTSAALFGSFARGDARPDSDVDISVRIDEARLSSGFAYFGLISRIERTFSEILERPVDIVVEPVRKETLRQAIERDRAVAF